MLNPLKLHLNMLITRNILNKALEDKVPLFHDGDYIDDDVFYDLFYAPPVLRNSRETALIPKADRIILCAELKGCNIKNRKEEYDVVYCKLRCKSCGKDFPFHITKSQIIYKKFKVSDLVRISGSPMYPNRYCAYYSSFNELFRLKFGESKDIYVCRECINQFVTVSNQEAEEILNSKDKFDWFLANENSDDWRKHLFYRDRFVKGIKITAINDEVYTDAEYDEWEKAKLQEEKEEEEYQKKVEELRRLQQINKEIEREKTKSENEAFLARHQSNTPTQRYINKFCRKDSKVDITDRDIQAEALAPEGVNYETVQKYNCKLYREYLQSPLWKIISSKVKWNAHNRCEKCGSTSNLEVHHTSYELKGVEFLGFHTLECLCSKCHKKEHKG